MTQLTRRSLLGTSALGMSALALPLQPETPAEKPAPFRLGLVTYNVAAAWDLPTLLKVCQAVGISPVELRTTHKHGVESSLSGDQRKEVKKRFADAGIDCWGCGSVCEFHSPDPKVVRQNIETCKQFIGLAAAIGGHGVKVRPNGLPREVAVEKTLDQIGKALAECGKAAADAGVEIWLEVHGKDTAHPPHIKTIMEACGHSAVGVTWNSNGTDITKGSVAEAFELLWPWIRSCHINDLYRNPKGYPYRELFGLFRTKGYNRVTLCEVGRTFVDPELGAEFLRYYKALWNELLRPGEIR